MKTTRHNSGLAKVAVQWLNKHLCFVSSVVLADSFVLRNRHLRQAAKRYRAFWDNPPTTTKHFKTTRK
jgi:hypothetical protein